MNKPNPFAALLNKDRAVAGKPVVASAPEKESASTPPPAVIKMPAPAISTASNPLMSLMASAPTMPTKFEKLEEPNTDSPQTLEQLAAFDTSTLSEQTKREESLLVQARRFERSIMLDKEDDVKTLCELIDVKIQNAGELNQITLIDIRNYVQKLMVTLKAKPEFDSVLIDKDVRNVMKFLRAVRNQAMDDREVKTVKAVARKEKKEAKVKDESALAKAFNNLLLNGPKP